MPKNKKSKHNYARIIGIIALAGIACFCGFFIANKINRRDDVSPLALEESSKEKLDSEIEDAKDEEPKAVSGGEDKTPVQYDGEDPNSLEVITGSVAFASILGDKITIRVNIDQYLSNGECLLTLGDYTERSSLVLSASTSTCEGFDVPLSSLQGLSGKNDFTITVTADNKSGTINGSIEL